MLKSTNMINYLFICFLNSIFNNEYLRYVCMLFLVDTCKLRKPYRTYIVYQYFHDISLTMSKVVIMSWLRLMSLTNVNFVSDLIKFSIIMQSKITILGWHVDYSVYTSDKHLSSYLDPIFIVYSLCF